MLFYEYISLYFTLGTRDLNIVNSFMRRNSSELVRKPFFQLQYELAHLPPSMIAAAALYLSLVALTPGVYGLVTASTCLWWLLLQVRMVQLLPLLVSCGFNSR